MDYDEFEVWKKQGAVITKSEYEMLWNIVQESMNKIVETHIRGSNEFIEAISMELNRRRDIVEKLRYLAFVKR